MTSTPSSISYSDQPTINDAEFSLPVASFSLEEYRIAYQYVVTKFGYAPVQEPGRIEILGWDLEYVCGPALANFIDQLLVRRLDDFIPDNDQPLILDCGANIGFSVLNYKRQFPHARIIAFEPDPQFAPILRRNLECNGAADVQVVEAAVWVKNGETRWLCEGIDGSKIITEGQEAPGTIIVQTVDLADYLSAEVDLLKIDIEGAEYEVVIHLADKLHRVKNMCIECHLDQQSNIGLFSKMLDTLVAAGFNVGINSFGPWRDLIRQTEILPDHWGQYLIVAAWRQPIPLDSMQDPLLPYGGIQQLKDKAELQAAQTKIKTIQAEFQTAQSQLKAAQTQLQATQLKLANYEGSQLIQLARKLTRR